MGALSILKLVDVAAVLENVQAYLMRSEAAEELSSQPEKLDAFADSITSIECYLEAIIAEEDNPKDILRYGVESVSRLVGAEAVIHANEFSDPQTIKVDESIADESEPLTLASIEETDAGKKTLKLMKRSI